MLSVSAGKTYVAFIVHVFQRTETLLKEYKNQGKSNTFIDKRFGEYNAELTEDQKMAKRFSLERQVTIFFQQFGENDLDLLSSHGTLHVPGLIYNLEDMILVVGGRQDSEL